MCRETEERKTEVDLEVLSAVTGGGRQSVGNRIMVEQDSVGKR